MMVFNKQYPGPKITADWGDIIQVTVKNSLPDNGTSIHWHGLRQLYSNQMDGTNGITECPIAPGQSKTYTFKATEYGSSWYHSHYSVQYADGLVGAIKINGPSTANYDVDLGTVPLTDWFHTPVFTVAASQPKAPPTSDSILVNGTGVLNGTGTYAQITLQPNKKNKISFINTGINAYLHVSVDQHPLTVIAADFVPIQPFTTNSLSIPVGQRYDVIIDANQTPGSYWFRVGTGGGQCDGPNVKASLNDTKGAIVSYAGSAGGQPTSQSYELGTGCADEVENIVPFVQKNVPAPSTAPTALALTLDTTAGVFWKVNGEAIDISWLTPTLSYIENGTYTLPANDNGLTISGEDWSYWLIQNDTPLPHPIHLHGHNCKLIMPILPIISKANELAVYVIGQGAGSGQGVAYNLTNPIRRDTHTVDAGGYLIIAFPSDNPGAWLMHCHIPFHISGGLGVQFLENPSEIIDSLGDLSGFTDGCKTWATYQNSVTGFSQGDSGLKKRRTVRRF
jgi:FtsP/CotA-like multicopper oxidase with cupredoxin domain